ncbi:unnamed protein product [Heterobilharzia americana]|nr:unnamed protein product [Heterobilharzia americana]
MSYEMLPYSNRGSGRDYRNGSRHAEPPYENSSSKKRYRDAPFQSRMSFENDEFTSPSKELRRNRHDVGKYRPDSRYNRDTNVSPIPKKRNRMDPRGDAPPPKPSRVLGAFGLSMRTEERHLYDIMKKYGDIEEIKVVQDNLSGRSRGFAFIYFRSIESARAARLRPHNPTPGVYMGKEKRTSHSESGRRSNFEEHQRPLYENRDSGPRSSQRMTRHPTTERPNRFRQSPTEETSRPRNSIAYSSSDQNRTPRTNNSVTQSRSRPSRPNVMRNTFDMRRQPRSEFASMSYSSGTN